jgi:hypothetical protein
MIPSVAGILFVAPLAGRPKITTLSPMFGAVGFDADDYVASAKIDHGNSDGAAIDVQCDCYLGIPTYTQNGHREPGACLEMARVVIDALLPRAAARTQLIDLQVNFPDRDLPSNARCSIHACCDQQQDVKALLSHCRAARVQ